MVFIGELGAVAVPQNAGAARILDQAAQRGRARLAAITGAEPQVGMQHERQAGSARQARQNEAPRFAHVGGLL